jgi:tetratricopeptide (TPR) repeat protein
MTLQNLFLRVPRWLLLGLLLGASLDCLAAGEPNPRERIDFWKRNFTAIAPESNARVERAQRIFARLVRIAGRRPGVEPRLHVIKESTAGALPIAIPDGWVVLSRRVIDDCYREPGHGDDRLAFVLAHEIAHHMQDDFWHMKFFQAIEAADNPSVDQSVLREVQRIAAASDNVFAKELRSDELGITYLVMAGFEPRAIVDETEGRNFFREWTSVLDPGRLVPRGSRTHPGPSQRAAAVQARLRHVAQQAHLFDMGMLFYQSGDYARAVLALEEFRRYFPGREVHHNLGVAHHQLALRGGHALADKRGEPLFKISMMSDPLSRAHGSTRNRPTGAAGAFERHIAAAMENYKTAINQDPAYLPAYRNLGSAHIANGEPYHAIAVLKEALKLAPQDAALLNNLGVAFALAGNPIEARAQLLAARAAEPGFDSALFNLASLAHRQSEAGEALRYGKLYLELDGGSDWAGIVRSRFGVRGPEVKPSPIGAQAERLAGVEIGAYQNEVPPTWGKPDVHSFQLEATPTVLARYPNGLMTVAQGDEIRLIATTAAFAGSSSRAIRPGQTRREVEARYGAPSLVLATTAGESLMYPAHGVSFSMQEGRVVSWVLFWN